mmetsp:Transcript_31155/g.47045  ORF Transcript_31155/g.47045 Transcript_31155/m.47045 type:complete len:203 (-) Transcript_31155:136-744(-)|eukprot:CAMPEP_0206466644 /NCGR_PEP_ID=MMETSP0324_2-20121206/28579_1 /ASSEMBLY_ACC=CAM_ASM_000836 /TAXON_ID=2866 /ORGANISM="Crypthecodinium cohnii, Strain Seligo" /LENGTH=202 /DNA_ID=CAMNT_0053939795 /DNA_START=179 /DNA_END=787 /DNA_ORIENTATION=-
MPMRAFEDEGEKKRGASPPKRGVDDEEEAYGDSKRERSRSWSRGRKVKDQSYKGGGKGNRNGKGKGKGKGGAWRDIYTYILTKGKGKARGKGAVRRTISKRDSEPKQKTTTIKQSPEDIQKAADRAARFGLPLPAAAAELEAAKKKIERAKRFGTSTGTAEDEVKKAERAKRFAGATKATSAAEAEEEEKRAKRAKRFENKA